MVQEMTGQRAQNIIYKKKKKKKTCPPFHNSRAQSCQEAQPCIKPKTESGEWKNPCTSPVLWSRVISTHVKAGSRTELVADHHPIIWMTAGDSCPHSPSSAETAVRARQNFSNSESAFRSISGQGRPGLEQLSPHLCLGLVRLSPGLEGSSCSPPGVAPS